MDGHAGRVLLFDRWMNSIPQDASDHFSSTPRLLIDNVADLVFKQDRKESWSYASDGDFPNVAPPFDQFWIEYSATFGPIPIRVGLLFTAESVSDELRTDLAAKGAVLPENCRWWIDVRAVLESRGHFFTFEWDSDSPYHRLGRSSFQTTWWVSSDGQFVQLRRHSDELWNLFSDGSGSYPASDEDLLDLMNRDTQTLLMPAWMALSFMHCKNVTTRHIEPPAKLSKAWKRKNGRPLARHYVLDIEPMRQVLQTEGNVDEVGLKQALHICRGHFKTYTPDRPLFGRTTGTFWWPMTARGHSPAGVVSKDYRVLAPKKEV